LKKLIVVCQILLSVFFLTKTLSYSNGFQETSFGKILSWDRSAIAQTRSVPPGLSPRDVTDDHLQKERDLLALLQTREKVLDDRERAIKLQEQNVLALKQELLEKIDAFKALEAQLSDRLEGENAREQKRIKDLAKVYDAAPPQKVAAMIEKLSVKTAAGITINMKRERAGLVWGFLNPQKAVEITNEITRTTRLPAQ
jgi:flagellar motility protein MotE (MotC chaperone)